MANNPLDREEMWKQKYWGPLENGMELSQEINCPQAVEMTVMERAPGLPDITYQSIALQTDYLLPYLCPDLSSHTTLISRSFTFE